MRYAVVTTTNYLLLVDLESKKTFPLEGEKPEYYGISWFPQAKDLVLSHSGLSNSTLVDITSYAQSEKGWISTGNRNSQKFLSQPHQILCAPDGRVICTNTGRNAITVIDLDKPSFYQETKISEARWDRLSLDQMIGDHLNSIFIQDNKLFAIAHRFNKGSLLGIFSYPNLDLLELLPLGTRTGLHNIWITPEGQRISCHSETGSLVDLQSETPLWTSGAPIYTRGLAASKNYVVIGESQKTGRDLRSSSMSGLWILDRLTWQAIDHICLGPYGAVNEVRLLDVPDEAHHSRPFAGLDQLIAQDDMLTLISQKRLTATKTAYNYHQTWSQSNCELIFGAPNTLPDGVLVAESDNLCLLVMKGQTTTLSFDFHLDPDLEPGVAHVSAVLNYKGKGGDTDMIAFLIQPAEKSKAALSVWQHNGSSWSTIHNIGISNLPLSGHLSLRIESQEVIITFDQKKILRTHLSSFGLEKPYQQLGIRWIGASIKNVSSKG